MIDKPNENDENENESGWYDRDESSWEDQLHQKHLDSYSEEP
jgi:hypothetical protein